MLGVWIENVECRWEAGWSDRLEDDDQSLVAWYWRANWAQLSILLMRLNNINPISEPPSVVAYDFLRGAANMTNYFPQYVRLSFVLMWFEVFPLHVQKLLAYLREHTPKMVELALSLVEEQAWMASSTRSSIDARRDTQKLMSYAVVVSIFLIPTTDHISRAIEILEAGRSLLWHQSSTLRASLDKLAAINPELSSRLRESSYAFEKQLGFSEPEHLGFPQCRNGV